MEQGNDMGHIKKRKYSLSREASARAYYLKFLQENLFKPLNYSSKQLLINSLIRD